MKRILAVIAAVASVSCRDSQQQHVFQAPRPTSPAPQASTPDVVHRVTPAHDGDAPTARITSVADDATGAPVSLGAIERSFQVQAVVSRGANEFPAGSVVHVDIDIAGTSDTTIAVHFGSPAPSTIAHNFYVPVARPGQPGLRSGRYTATVRLMVDDRPRATSAPVYFTID